MRVVVGPTNEKTQRSKKQPETSSVIKVFDLPDSGTENNTKRFVLLLFVAMSSKLGSSYFTWALRYLWPLTSTKFFLSFSKMHLLKINDFHMNEWVNEWIELVWGSFLVMELYLKLKLTKNSGEDQRARSQLVFRSLSTRRIQVQFVQCQFAFCLKCLLLIRFYIKHHFIANRKLNWIGLESMLNDDCCWWHSHKNYQLQNAI